MNASQQIIGCVQATFPADWRALAHSHDGIHEMLLVIRGELAVERNSRVTHCRQGNCILYQAGEVHREWAVAGDVILFCLGWRGTFGGDMAPLVSDDPQGRIRYIAKWIHDLHARNDASGRRTMNGLLQGILDEYFSPPLSDDEMRIARVRRHIHENYPRPMRLDELAGIAHFSKYHFAREFVRVVGMTPMQYVRQARLEAARGLLLTTSLPLRTIAEAVGLPDEFHLSRAFRRVFGHAPSLLRSRKRS